MIRRKIPWDTWGPKRFPSAQCRAFLECENIPGLNGYCAAHPPRRGRVGMTPPQIRAWWKSRPPDDLRRLLKELGVSDVNELASFQLSVSAGGAVVRREKLGDANEAFRETHPGRDD